MAGNADCITVNQPGITISDRSILLHLLQHAEAQDTLITDLTETIGVMAGQLSAMHEELEAARPLLEKWTRRAVIRLAAGRLPL